MDNLDRLISEVRKIASERPNVTSDTKSCMYDSGVCSDGSVGCLFGQGFEAIGWKPYSPNNSNLSVLGVLDSHYGDNDKLDWCSEVQDCQDNGMSWGESVKSVDEQRL